MVANDPGIGALRLYWRYIAMSFKAQMQFKVSFLISSVAGLIVTGVEVIAIWALFDRFGNLPGWTMPEICLFYGLVNMAFAISEALSPGFDYFGRRFVRTGDFDRVLLRPRSIILQLVGYELSLRRVGRFLQGFAVFVWACFYVDITWGPLVIAIVIFALAGGTAIFVGLFVYQALLSFWTVESLEIMNTMTYGGAQTVQYPLTIYTPWFRRLFTFVVPLACVSYFPMMAVLGKQDPLGSAYWFQVAAPAAGFIFLGIALLLFRYWGVRHYTSTGS